jgi:ribosome recycling factor
MNNDLEFHLEHARESMGKALKHLEDELTKIRAGKASPQMLDGIMVDYYGTPTPLNQVSTINTPDAKTLSIKPWEKKMLEPIEKAVFAANLGVTPVNDGETIRIIMPPLTEERRKEMVKKAKAEGEHAKVSIRNTRRDANEHIKSLQKNGVPEDVVKDGEDRVQHLTNDFIGRIDKLLEAKETDIMKV